MYLNISWPGSQVLFPTPPRLRFRENLNIFYSTKRNYLFITINEIKRKGTQLKGVVTMSAPDKGRFGLLNNTLSLLSGRDTTHKPRPGGT